MWSIGTWYMCPVAKYRFLLLRVGQRQRGYALRSLPVVNPESAKPIPLSEQIPIRQSGMGVEWAVPLNFCKLVSR
jgi:hypothetical protein